MAEIVKANTLPPHERDNFLLTGQAGGGKTQLACTLPGKTLAFALDKSARAIYRKYPHIDILEYANSEKDLTVYSLSKKLNTTTAPGQKPERGLLYQEVATDINRVVRDGILEQYDNVIIDSATTLQDIIMEAVLAKNGRAGQPPQQDDYLPQMNLIEKIFDMFCAAPVRTVFICHDTFKQDETTSKMYFMLMITGQLKNKLPNRFNHLLRCSSKPGEGGKATYFIQTTPTRYAENIRTSYEGLDPEHDVTILDHSKVQEYGLGKIIKEQKVDTASIPDTSFNGDLVGASGGSPGKVS